MSKELEFIKCVIAYSQESKPEKLIFTKFTPNMYNIINIIWAQEIILKKINPYFGKQNQKSV